MRQTFLDTPEDMAWLREVHLPRLDACFQSALLCGNEDCPREIHAYHSANPQYNDIPTVYKLGEDGEYTQTPVCAGEHCILAPEKGDIFCSGCRSGFDRE